MHTIRYGVYVNTRDMKKLNYFKIGAVAYMLLGVMHLISQSSKDGLRENVLQSFVVMRAATFDFMGQHDLMQFYTGFSITMGFMLFAFGLQAFAIKQPAKSVAVANMLVSLVAAVLSVVYFHPLAWLFLFFAALCFAISLSNMKNRESCEESR